MAEVATVAAYVLIASSLTSAGMAYHSYDQAGKAAEATSKFNAQLAQREAEQKAAIARLNMKRQRSEDRRYLSAMRAKMAASGVAMKGTPVSVLGQSAGQLEQNVIDLAYEADAKYRSLYLGSRLTLAEGRAQKQANQNKAISAAIGGLGSTSQSLVNLKKQDVI